MHHEYHSQGQITNKILLLNFKNITKHIKGETVVILEEKAKHIHHILFRIV